MEQRVASVNSKSHRCSVSDRKAAELSGGAKAGSKSGNSERLRRGEIGIPEPGHKLRRDSL